MFFRPVFGSRLVEEFLNATFEPSRRPLPIPALALRQAALGAIWHGVV